MNYYERHIGDYLKDTAHLSLLEHGVYTRLMDVYYTREGPIPAKEAARLIGARSKDEREALETVLAEFFVLVEGVHRQERCEREIKRYHGKTPDREAKRENDRERQRRARERRKELFEALRGHGLVPAFDTTTAELEALLSQHPKRDGHADVTPPVTRDNTATQTPDTKHQNTTPLPPGEGARTREGTGKSPEATADRPDKARPAVASPQVAVAVALRQAGIDANAHHPKLLALVQAGATVEEFMAFADKAKLTDNAFPYLLGCVEGERKRAAATAGQLHRGAMPAVAPATPSSETVEAYQARMAAEREADRQRMAGSKGPSPEVKAKLAALAGGMRTT